MTTTLTARVPEDLLAVVPVVLGFRPSDSLVMLTFGATRSFHARVDLPPPSQLRRSLPELVQVVLTPAVTQHVERVAFVAYSDDAPGSALLAAALSRAFLAKGIDVVTLLRAHAGSWCRLPASPGGSESEPMPYDDTTHPFAVQAVLDGLVTHPSRDDLRDTLAASPSAVARVAELQAHGEMPETGPSWVLDLIARCVDSGERPDDAEAARLLTAIVRWEVRDAALFAITRELAVRQLEVWADLLRRAPDPQVPDTAALTAFCAWQVGAGALAWCAVDRCLSVDPHHVLGRHLAECLSRAIPPTAWAETAARRRADPREPRAAATRRRGEGRRSRDDGP